MNSVGATVDQAILSSIYANLVSVPLIGFLLPTLAWCVPCLLAHPTLKLVWSHKPTLTPTENNLKFTNEDLTKKISAATKEADDKTKTAMETAKKLAEDKGKLEAEILELKKKVTPGAPA